MIFVLSFPCFSYIVKEPPDGLYGMQGPDGKFSGMMGMLQNDVRNKTESNI